MRMSEMRYSKIGNFHDGAGSRYILKTPPPPDVLVGQVMQYARRVRAA